MADREPGGRIRIRVRLGRQVLFQEEYWVVPGVLGGSMVQCGLGLGLGLLCSVFPDLHMRTSLSSSC